MFYLQGHIRPILRKPNEQYLPLQGHHIGHLHHRQNHNHQNQDLLKHYKDVTAITIGRLIGKMIPEMSWLLEKLPNHYDHPNSKSISQPALLFTKAPWYYQETKNLDIQLICEQIQTDFLNMVGEQMPDKMAFLRDIELIQDQDTDRDLRIAAEARVHEAVED